MIVYTCISKKYVLSREEEEVLNRAAGILDNLYAYSKEDGEREKEFREARDSLVYILEKIKFDGECSYWREDASKETTTQE